MTQKKNKINILFYVNFLIATIAITEFFTSHKYFTAGDSTKGYLVVVFSLVVFFLSLLMMAFQIYKEEKDKGNVQVEFAPFEYLYERISRHAENISRHSENISRHSERSEESHIISQRSFGLRPQDDAQKEVLL